MSLDFLEEFYRRSICGGVAFQGGFMDIADIPFLDMPEHEIDSKDHGASDFIIAESEDKLTLFNADFAIWLVPEFIQGEAVTRGYIALHQKPGSYNPEIAFQARGEYNQSALILQALHFYLQDIQDTEQTLHSLQFRQE